MNINPNPIVTDSKTQSSLTSAHHPSQTDTVTAAAENDEMGLRDDLLYDDVKTQQTLSVDSESTSHEPGPDCSWKTDLEANTSALLESQRRSFEISRKLSDLHCQLKMHHMHPDPNCN